MLWTVVGISASVLTMFSFVPQIFKLVKTKSAADVSMLTLIQLSIGVSLWIVYGIYLRNPIIIMANSVTLSTLIIALLLCFIYRKNS